MTRPLAVFALIGALSAPVGAQVAVGDSLWQRGRIAEATLAYQRAILDDRYSVRANILVARSMAWSNNIDSALALLRNARVRVPDDPDVRYTEGLYLSWGKRFDEAVLRYDSLLMTNPELDYVRVARARTLSWAGKLGTAEAGYRDVLGRPVQDKDAVRDADVGLAQVESWSGDLPAAAARYNRLLADDPTDARVLIGLASVRTWQGRPSAAVPLLERAVEKDSANVEARAMLVSARAAAVPRSDIEFDWSDDSDGDRNFWLVASHRVFLREWLSLNSSLGELDARDPSRDANRALGELALTASSDLWRLSAALGGRSLNPATSGIPSRGVLTERVSATLRLPAGATASVSIAHFPFDEIAGLIARSIDLTAMDASLDLVPSHGTNVGFTGGVLDFSDGNRRLTAIVRASQHWNDRPWIGVYGRYTSFAEKQPGYFSPNQFLIYELQGGWEREVGEWNGSIGGGVGEQQVALDKPWQNAYHVETRVAHKWTNGNTVALSAGISTSAASSAVGAFRYRTAGVSASLGW